VYNVYNRTNIQCVVNRIMKECPVCHEVGYLYQEKPREKRPHTRKVKRSLDWSTMKPKITQYNPYPDSRVRHGYWFFVHNIRIMKGKWKTRRCYLGINKRPFKKI